jgi:hypothetical protein
MVTRTSQRFLRSLLVLPCLLGILVISPLFAQPFLQAGLAPHAIIAAGSGMAAPQMPGPPK